MLSKLPAYTKYLMNGKSNNNYYYRLLDTLITTIISRPITIETTFLTILFISEWRFPLLQSF